MTTLASRQCLCCENSVYVRFIIVSCDLTTLYRVANSGTVLCFFLIVFLWCKDKDSMDLPRLYSKYLHVTGHRVFYTI